jgi:hypothetical protein
MLLSCKSAAPHRPDRQGVHFAQRMQVGMAHVNDQPVIDLPTVRRLTPKPMVLGVLTDVSPRLSNPTSASISSYSPYWQKDNENPALETFLKLLSERYPSPCLGS